MIKIVGNKKNFFLKWGTFIILIICVCAIKCGTIIYRIWDSDMCIEKRAYISRLFIYIGKGINTQKQGGHAIERKEVSFYRKNGSVHKWIPLPYISIITHYCGFVKRNIFFLCVDAVMILPHLHMKDIE